MMDVVNFKDKNYKCICEDVLLQFQAFTGEKAVAHRGLRLASIETMKHKSKYTLLALVGIVVTGMAVCAAEKKGKRKIP